MDHCHDGCVFLHSSWAHQRAKMQKNAKHPKFAWLSGYEKSLGWRCSEITRLWDRFPCHAQIKPNLICIVCKKSEKWQSVGVIWYGKYGIPFYLSKNLIQQKNDANMERLHLSVFSQVPGVFPPRGKVSQPLPALRGPREPCPAVNHHHHHHHHNNNNNNTNNQQPTNNKQQTTNNKQQTTNNKQQTTNKPQQTTNGEQQSKAVNTNRMAISKATKTNTTTACPRRQILQLSCLDVFFWNLRW